MDARKPVESVADEPVAVWDLAVRLVHWAMVLLLVVLVATGIANYDWLKWHILAGCSMLTLVLFRIGWGFIGSRNARFGSFVRGPGTVLGYLRGMRDAHRAYATHNPMGALMVLALLAALLAQCLLGLFTSGDSSYAGPLSSRVSEDLSERLSWIHRRLWWVIAGLVVLHVAAVAAHYALWRDNLVRPMLDGDKRLPPGRADAAHARASVVAGLVLFAACAALVAYVATR